MKADYINKIITQIYADDRNARFKYPVLREGQSLYNAAYKYVPVLCEKVTGTVKDPFYNNGSIEMFMDAIYEYLNKQEEETLKEIGGK